MYYVQFKTLSKAQAKHKLTLAKKRCVAAQVRYFKTQNTPNYAKFSAAQNAVWAAQIDCAIAK